MESSLPAFSRRAGQELEVFLDGSALDASGHDAWLALIEHAADSLGISVAVTGVSSLPPDDGCDFSYISDSAALSRKLLLSAPRIHVQPVARPQKIDSLLYWKLPAHAEGADSWEPVDRPVTLISSVFRGDGFLPGFLENCAALQEYDACQHLLIRAGSPGMEQQRLIEHVRQWPAAVYINLARDPGLYEVWNLGARLATGRYLSNANIDDRRAPAQLEYLRKLLDATPGVDAASTALRVSEQRNLGWEASASCRVMFGGLQRGQSGVDALFKATPAGLASQNFLHCMPLWRRSLHAWVGCFDEKRYGPSADWAFWVHAGMRGCRFAFSAEPLGLYLQDEESYWRRNPARGQADRRIVSEYLEWKQAVATRDAAPLHASSSHLIAAAIDMFRAGAALEGLCRLLVFASRAERLTELERTLVDRVALRYLGCAGFLDLLSQVHIVDAPDPTSWLADSIGILAGLIHALGASAAPVARGLELACVDLDECSGGPHGLLLLALLAHQRGDGNLEQRLLWHAHAADPVAFWKSVQQVYRFTVSLPDLCERVSDIPARYTLDRPASEYRVVFYPASLVNRYQDGLYLPLQQAGGQVRGVRDEQALLEAALEPVAENVLHIHWVNRLFLPQASQATSVEARAAGFLEALHERQQRGFRIFWTIHNHLSHETAHPEAEVAFRRALYRLADRVFVHHPLAAELLDWLPDRTKLFLCEHGPYEIADSRTIPRASARRQLSLVDDDFVIAHLGHLRDNKGLDELLPALVAHLDKTPRMKLLIGGQIRSKAVRSWLHVNPHRRLHVHDGHLSDDELLVWMRAADFGLLSYREILTSGSLFHWFSCGRPVLSPLIGTIPAYLVSGWNGFGYGDSASLLKLLDRCARLSGNAREALDANALATARQLEWRMWKLR